MKRSLSPSPEDAALQPEDLQVEEQGVPSATAKPKTKKSTPSQSSVADKKKGKHWPRKQVQKEGRSENEGDGGDSDGDDQVTSPKSTPKKAKTKQTSSSPSGQDPAGLGYPTALKLQIIGTYLDKGKSGMTMEVWEALGQKYGKTGTQLKDTWRKSLYPRLFKAIESGAV